MAELTKQVQRIAQNIPGTIDVDNSMEEGQPEIQIDIDRKKADDLGLSLSMIPLTLRTFVEGDVVTKFKEGDEEYDVRVQLQKEFRSSTDDLNRILVESDKVIPGQEEFLVPLGRVGKIDKGTAIGKYLRFNRQNEVRVNSNVLNGYFSGTIAQEILAKLSNLLVGTLQDLLPMKFNYLQDIQLQPLVKKTLDRNRISTFIKHCYLLSYSFIYFWLLNMNHFLTRFQLCCHYLCH